MYIPSPLEVWALSPCDAAHIFAAAFRSPPGAEDGVSFARGAGCPTSANRPAVGALLYKRIGCLRPTVTS